MRERLVGQHHLFATSASAVGTDLPQHLSFKPGGTENALLQHGLEMALLKLALD